MTGTIVSSISQTSQDSEWNGLLKIGGLAALISGIGFRRNMGAEVSLFGIMPPSSALDWFTLLNENRLLGLVFLDLLDIINYLLVGLMFVSLYFPLRKGKSGYMLIASMFGILGTAITVASNAAFSMLSLSSQFANATTEAEREVLLAAGEGVLALSQSTGFYTGFILIATAGLIASAFMQQGNVFSRTIAYIGISASICDYACCIALVVLPDLAVLFVSVAGLLLTIWHILVGWKLFSMSRTRGVVGR